MVYIILGTGFEETEAIVPADVLIRGGLQVAFVAAGTSKLVESSHGIDIKATKLISEIVPTADDTIVIPGGLGGINSIKRCMDAMNLISVAAKAGCTLAAICAGPEILAELGLLKGRRITCHPASVGNMGRAICDCSEPALTDGNIVTGRSAGAAMEFGLELLKLLAGAEQAKKTRQEFLI